MKKCLIWAAVLCLLLECFLGAAAADTGSDNSATSGVDVIVVMDMSGSMTTRENQDGRKVQGNDDNAFRIDATAMLVGMLDMDGSRIGIVPFAGTVLDAGVKDLTVVDTPARREAFVSELYDKIARTRGDSTNTGAALMRALYMLQQREDTSNRPMIVLLTDGKNAITNSQQGVVNPSYRWENGEIVNQHQQTFNTDMADAVTREAVEAAREMGIPIYTVSLTLDPYSSSSTGISLASVSEMTGVGDGCLWAKTRDDAKDIPGYFAKVLANKIGSSVQIITAPQKVDGTQKTYEVLIPVLNESIREINIILPVKKGKANLISGIDASTIRILNAHMEPQTTGTDEGVSILRSEKGSFAMIKIRKPKRGSTGMWHLQFDSDTDPSDITFNFLYNYNVKLNAAVTTERGDNQYYKSDKLILSAFFADENGNASSDPSLYADHTGEPDFEAWMTIRARWQLFEVDADGRTAEQPIRTGEMQAQEVPLQFGSEIDLTENTPKSGQFKLVFTAEGAGMIRTVELPLTLNNHVPQAEGFEHTIEVNSTAMGKEYTWTVDGTSGVLDKKAWEIVTDEDPEDQASLVFSLVREGNQEQAAEMTLEADGTIRYTTILEGGAIKDGAAIYRLEYNDGDSDGSGSVLIRLNIYSDIVAILAKYDPEISITGTNADGYTDDDLVFRKNTPVTITVRLKNKDGSGYAEEEMLSRFATSLIIADQATGEPSVSDPAFILNGDTLEYTVESTGNKAAEWTVTATVGPFEGDALIRQIRIPNQFDPEADTAEDVTFSCTGEKVPGFLQTVIGENTPEDDPTLKIQVGDLFSDKDNDILEYSVPAFRSLDGQDMDPADITAAPQGDDGSGEYLIRVTGQRTSIFNFTYQCRMEITATDGDGKTATYEQMITVVDLYNKMLTYLIIVLAAIIALIILFLIIHQIRKPRFPRLNLTIREEPSLYESGSETLSPVKTPTNANAMGVDSDMAAKHGISMELLQNIIIKPIRSTLAVGVVCRKAIPGQEVTLDDVRLKAKKQYTWKIEQELSIHNDRSESMIVIKLENRETVEPEDVLDDFGGSDDWSDEGAGTSGSKAGRKRSKKVERKAKPAASDETSSGTNDDFDF